jgi:outer membrane protein TolC
MPRKIGALLCVALAATSAVAAKPALARQATPAQHVSPAQQTSPAQHVSRAQPATPVQQPVLTLHDAVRSALARNPALEHAAAAVDRSAAGLRETGASLLPAAHVDATLTRFQEPMVVAPLHGFDPANPPVFDRTLSQASATVGWVAFDGGARGARVARAGALLDGSTAQRLVVEQQVIAEVVRRYAGVLTARELDAAYRSSVAALEEERDRAARLLEEGRAARLVLLRAEAALSGALAEQAGTGAAVASAERELARWLGVPADTVATLRLAPASVGAGVADRTALVGSALQRNPELQRIAAEAAARAAAVAESRAQWWPTLHLGGRYVQYGSAAGNAGGEWQAGLQLSYALFTGAARPAATDRARADARAAAAELAMAELRVADAVDRALAGVVATEARVAAWQAAVEQSAEVVRIERLALDTGGGVQTDYLRAEADLLRARAALTDARYAALVAHAELARATGELTVDWLERNVESGT